MRTKHTISLILFIIAAGLIGWWVYSGHQMWTTTEHMIEVKDELFGTMSQKWVPGLTPGLEWLGPISAMLMAGGVWLSMRSHKERMVVPKGPMTEDERMMHYDTLKKSAAVIYGMWLLFGWAGAHRTIEGRVWSGVVMLVTTLFALFLSVIGVGLWGFGVVAAWWFLDLFLIQGWVKNYNEELIARLEHHPRR